MVKIQKTSNNLNPDDSGGGSGGGSSVECNCNKLRMKRERKKKLCKKTLPAMLMLETKEGGEKNSLNQEEIDKKLMDFLEKLKKLKTDISNYCMQKQLCLDFIMLLDLNK